MCAGLHERCEAAQEEVSCFVASPPAARSLLPKAVPGGVAVAGNGRLPRHVLFAAVPPAIKVGRKHMGATRRVAKPFGVAGSPTPLPEVPTKAPTYSF